MESLGDKKELKQESIFYCSNCNYTCNKKYNWERHLNATKHIKRSKCESKKEQNISNQNTCEYCNKSYKSRNGLWRHKKKCIEKDKVKDEKDLMLIIIKDNIELKKIILEQQQLLLEIVKKPL